MHLLCRATSDEHEMRWFFMPYLFVCSHQYEVACQMMDLVLNSDCITIVACFRDTLFHH